MIAITTRSSISVNAAFFVTRSWEAGGVSFVFFRRCVVVGGWGRVRRPPHPRRPARCLVGEHYVVVGGWGRVRRPPHPRRPARCRCRVRVGAGLGCGRPARGERAAKTRTALPAFLRKGPFAFLLHFAACRAETLLRDDNWPIGCLRDGWYGERRALTSRFLSPDPLSCLRSGNTTALADLTSFYHEEEFDQCETKKIPARNTGMHETGVGLLQRQT